MIKFCFVLFCLQELKDVLRSVPEILVMIRDADRNRVLLLDDHASKEEDLKAALRLAFTQLMSASKILISRAISDLKRRLHSESEVAMLCFIWFSSSRDLFFLAIECRNHCLSLAITLHSLLLWH